MGFKHIVWLIYQNIHYNTNTITVQCYFKDNSPFVHKLKDKKHFLECKARMMFQNPTKTYLTEFVSASKAVLVCQSWFSATIVLLAACSPGAGIPGDGGRYVR